MNKYTLKSLFWEATLRCNAYCSFCGSRCGDIKTAELDGKTIIRTFQRISEVYDPSSIMVNVTGGEPLLREDLFDIMNAVHQMGFSWGMVTNGSLINDHVVSEMKRTGMSTISISIDALGKMHDSIRRLNGGFARIIDAIHKLHEEAILDELQITTVVSKKNIDMLYQMHEHFRLLPVDSWRVAPVDPIGRAKDQNDLLLDAGDWARLLQFFDDVMFDENLLVTTSCSHYLGNYDTLFRDRAFHCEAGKTVASILADGTIHVCPNVPRRRGLVQGNVRTDDIVQIWQNGFQWFRDDENRRGEKCRDCGLWDQCRGDSLHSWSFDDNSPGFCYLNYGDVKTKELKLPEKTKKTIQTKVKSLSGIHISYGNSSSESIFFTPHAANYLHCFFRWGESVPANFNEQMAAIIGWVKDGQIYVDEMIPVALSDHDRETAYFTMNHHVYVEREIQRINENISISHDLIIDRKEKYVFLGYIHSHPGELEPIMSVPDIELHRLLCKTCDKKVISGIVNPQKKEICLYSNSVYTPMDLVLLMEEEDIGKWD